MEPTEILFWIISGIAIFSALMVLLSKNPVYSVLWLILVFFCITNHYILLNAQFLAIVNMIVYAGAIMVLFLFVIMLMNLNTITEPRRTLWIRLAGVVSGGLLLTVIISTVRSAVDLNDKKVLMNTGDIGLIENLGKVLFTSYAIPFEISSILFLSAMVGAVVIGKKE